MIDESDRFARFLLPMLGPGCILILMILDQIRQRLQNGFHPFMLRLSDGRELRVPQRDLVALHPKVIVLIDDAGISHTINPLHIVSIADPAPTA